MTATVVTKGTPSPLAAGEGAFPFKAAEANDVLARLIELSWMGFEVAGFNPEWNLVALNGIQEQTGKSIKWWKHRVKNLKEEQDNAE